MGNSDRLQKLKQQRQQIEDSIRREKRKLAGEERRKATRRKILVGAIVISESQNDPQLLERVRKILDDKLTREDDRALFNLESNEDLDSAATR